ncbi:hypothetical protein SVAN01_02460 [Stagonosporopsis vannaccii]|nr:hypothetical protein SVAN01_02460 [Stagonosporopsis vannaccii]
MKISRVATWSQGSTNGRLNPMVTIASQQSPAANAFRWPASVIVFEHPRPGIYLSSRLASDHHHMYASSLETRIVRQYARTDNQVSRITAFVSGANACFVRTIPPSMGYESGRLGAAIGFVPERVERSSSPCVDLQILKLQDARLITSNQPSTLLSCTQAAVHQPCIGRITSPLEADDYTADCMAAYDQVDHQPEALSQIVPLEQSQSCCIASLLSALNHLWTCRIGTAFVSREDNTLLGQTQAETH